MKTAKELRAEVNVLDAYAKAFWDWSVIAAGNELAWNSAAGAAKGSEELRAVKMKQLEDAH